MNFYSILRIITGVIGAFFVILVFLMHGEGDRFIDIGILRFLQATPHWLIFVSFGGMPIFYFLYEWANEENVRVALKETFEFFKTIYTVVIVGIIFFIVMNWLLGIF